MFNIGHKIPGVSIPEHVSRKMISDQLNALVKNTPDVIPFDYKPNLALMKQYGFENYEEDAAAFTEAPPATVSLTIMPPQAISLPVKK